MVLEGGLRDRMVVESVRKHIVDHLTTLGWFDTNREHSPLVVVSGFPDGNDVAINTVAFSVEVASGLDLEMGSHAEEHDTQMFIDMFMENDSVGWHLSGDIYFFLKKNRVLDIFDFSQTLDPVDFKADIEHVDRRKPARATQAWQKFWHTVSFSVVDTRSNA